MDVILSKCRTFYKFAYTIVFELHKPQHVATFQKLCGIEWIKEGKNGTDHSEDASSHKESDASAHMGCEYTEHQQSSNDEYEITNIFLYWFFFTGSGFATEACFFLIFGLMIWSMDEAVARCVFIVWALIMYIGQVLKDLVKWPRPQSPPVVRLENRYVLEYGMPSTHAMVGMVVPFSFLYYSSHHYEFTFSYGMLIATCWCTLISLSRLYLGMHSILDVLAGLLLAMILMALVMPFVEAIDTFQVSVAYAPLAIFCGSLALAISYPKTEEWRTTYGDTIAILGSLVGGAIGFWCNNRGIPKCETYKFGKELHPIIWPDMLGLGIIITRTSIGIGMILVLRKVFKTVLITILCYTLKIDIRDNHARYKRHFQFMYNYVLYMFLLFFVVICSPIIFNFLGVEVNTDDGSTRSPEYII